MRPRTRQPSSRRTEMGTLCYGDNLDILRRYIADESVDLLYPRNLPPCGR